MRCGQQPPQPMRYLCDGHTSPAPHTRQFVSFASLKLHASLHRGLKELGFTRPTPIQLDAIPPALEGRDLLACAQTGSGKTLAFLLPLLNHLMNQKRGVTRALVITPTRELAAQIVESMNEVAVHTPLTAAAVYGGVGMGPRCPSRGAHSSRAAFALADSKGCAAVGAVPGRSSRPSRRRLP